MKISRNAETIPPSGTMQMKEIATSVESTGKAVIHLEVGEPDFPTPQAIIDELCKAANAGNTKYTSAKGIAELREAISETLSKKNIVYNTDDEIIATPGSKHALFMGMQALLNPGDEIIILTPAWPTYMAIPLALGAKPIETSLTDKLQIDEERVKANISEKTKVILVNSPSNPTGKGFSEDEVKFLADIATDKDLAVISDEVYGKITYNGYKHSSLSSLPGMTERTLLIDGCSKTYSMTGWRLGWGAGPKSVISAMVKLQQASTSCPAAMVQK
ncbi:MAG: pyridoxal phosphate-dependent aminotransferase, partial [Candidatus Ranarchaeia archaeon]